MSENAVMGRWRRLILPILVAGAAFPSVAQAEFCGIVGESPQEIADNVVKTREFKKIGRNARYVGYFNKAAMVTLTFTTRANKAHPAAVCRHAVEKGGDWMVSTELKCTANQNICKAMLTEFGALDLQMIESFGKAIP